MLGNSVTELSAGELLQISSLILSLYQPYQLDESNFHQLIELMEHDKKNENNKINFTLLSEIGKAHFNVNIDVDLILESLNYYNSLLEKESA